MQEKKNILTEDGVKQYEEELKELQNRLVVDIPEKLKIAMAQGDLSENAEYDAAKEEQAKVAARIEQLQKMLKKAEVVSDEDIDTSSINIGCVVKILDIDYDEEMEYRIVGSHEANSLAGKISNESPVGSALIGHKKGDIVDVETQAGIMKIKVLEIKKATSKDKDEA